MAWRQNKVLSLNSLNCMWENLASCWKIELHNSCLWAIQSYCIICTSITSVCFYIYKRNVYVNIKQVCRRYMYIKNSRLYVIILIIIDLFLFHVLCKMYHKLRNIFSLYYQYVWKTIDSTSVPSSYYNSNKFKVKWERLLQTTRLDYQIQRLGMTEMHTNEAINSIINKSHK